MILLTLVVVFCAYADAHHRSTRTESTIWSRGDDDIDNDGNWGVFYSSLSSYGGWTNCSYGRVWRPFRLRQHWRPYLDGRWIWTDYGWYWSSFEPFGWAVYHYGRWQYDDYYGWIWIPDNVWGPAWVEWRYDDDYIGWAPLTPAASFSFSVGVTLTGGWVAPLHYWNFIPCRYFTASRLADHVQPMRQTRRFFGNTRGAAGIRMEQDRVVNRGVDVGFIERRTNARIDRAEVVQTTRQRGERIVRESNRERIEIYRPLPDVRSRERERTIGPNRSNDRYGNELENSPSMRGGPGRRSYDEQQAKPPADEELQRGITPRVHQFRESEQRFEIPRRVERDRSREEQILENHGRMLYQENRDQPRQNERSQDRGSREDQIRDSHGRSNFEKTPPQVRERPQQQTPERSQRQPQSRDRGRRP